MIFGSKTWKTVYANDFDAFIPELWASESLAILEENMVVGQLVHRDFSPEIANFGDIVNTRKPSEFEAKRKTDNDNVTIQDASATNIAVPLNQHPHVSFLIRDGEQAKAFKNLREEYLVPANIALARQVDRILLGQAIRFRSNFAGQLGQLSSSNVKSYILDTRKVMNINKAPVENRSLILSPSAETEALKLDLFVSAEQVGDNGTALRDASLGRKLGFNTFMAQNTPDIAWKYCGYSCY